MFWKNTHPIRASLAIALAFLVIPGSTLGLVRLLGYAGWPLPLAAVPAWVHALVQSLGFFLVLIWAFLVRGMPGMLGGGRAWGPRMIAWMFALAAALAALVSVHLVDFRAGSMAAGAAVLAALLGGTAVLWHAALQSERPLLEAPFLMLLGGLTMAPVATAIVLFTPWGSPGGTHLLVYGSIVPITLAMGVRMLPAMVGLDFPHERIVAAGAFLLPAGMAVADWAPAPWSIPGAAASAIGGLAAAWGMRVFAPRRVRMGIEREPELDAVLRLYVRIAFGFLALSGLVHLLGRAGGLPGNGYFWVDVARHQVAAGFALLLVMGLTQRVFPSMLRTRRASVGGYCAVLALVTLGVLLRTAEPMLPAAAGIVAASAVFLYGGVFWYAVQLAPALVPDTQRPARRTAGSEA